MQDMALLAGGGSVSNQAMEDSVRETYAVFDARRKAVDARAADEADLKALEESIQHRKKETRRLSSVNLPKRISSVLDSPKTRLSRR